MVYLNRVYHAMLKCYKTVFDSIKTADKSVIMVQSKMFSRVSSITLLLNWYMYVTYLSAHSTLLRIRVPGDICLAYKEITNLFFTPVICINVGRVNIHTMKH
jgi:hypothetical protein